MFDINKFKNFSHNNTRFTKRINLLSENNTDTNSIEYAVNESIKNFNNGIKSFVIYGEPQSGKTEMMIALTAKLLDEGYKNIILLLNDNVQLLNQNLDRFKDSGLDPTPQNYKEILDKGIDISKLENVIFCKKNSGDLQKLIGKLGKIENKVIIDDEADYATPNGKINKEELTTINKLVGDLLKFNSYYIGVTATPARLDLNNTFNNSSKNWVNFPTHPYYTGQDVFFPIDTKKLNFNLKLLPNENDDPKYIKEALFSFMINVAYQNITDNGIEKNFSMLIHTSGKKADHYIDFDNIKKIYSVLYDENNSKYNQYVEIIWKMSKEKYDGNEDDITKYILKNKKRNSIILINSDGEKDQVPSAVNPSTLFTIAIGGNIVSRGVTFNNLISMFFTRDVKHKIQQDTYIQRARMFGARGKTVKYFDLYIPEDLYTDWHRCFIYHRLALSSLKNGDLVWFEDSRISSVSSSSVDKINISFSKGEMSFELFDYDKEQIDNIINENYGINSLNKIELVKKIIGNKGIPDFLLDFIKTTTESDDRLIGIYKSLDIVDRGDYVDKENIVNKKGSFLTDLVRDKTYDNPLHKLRIFYNSNTGKARLFYKYSGCNVNFIKNKKYDK